MLNEITRTERNIIHNALMGVAGAMRNNGKREEEIEILNIVRKLND